MSTFYKNAEINIEHCPLGVFALIEGDLISACIHEAHTWEAETSNIIIIILLNNGRNCIDVGANLGWFTVLMSKMLENTDYKVYSFEPQDIIYNQLCTNIFLNKCENIITYKNALGEKEDTIYFRNEETEYGMAGYPMNYGGIGIISEHDTKNYKNIIESNRKSIKLLALDSFKEINGVGLIKVDVQGMEIEFLKGAKNIIEINRPIILIEINPWNVEYITFYFNSIKFSLYQIKSENCTSENYIIIPNEIKENIIQKISNYLK